MDNIIYGEVVKAWIGQSDEGTNTLFTKCGDNDECCIYSHMLPSGTWVAPLQLHKSHVKRIETIVRH